MIVAERKKIPELLNIVKGHKKLLVLGCGTCVTVCLAGGEREVGIISSALRIASRLQGIDLEVEELTIERQCDNIFIEQAAEAIERNDAVLSLAAAPASRPSPSAIQQARLRRSEHDVHRHPRGAGRLDGEMLPPAARACCTSTAASARSRAAPSTC